MSDELKLCPFCGGSNTTLDYYEISGPQELGTIVVCNDCGASAKSIVDWNTRPIEDDLRNRIAELEALVDELKPYRDGYDAYEDFSEEGETVIANLGSWLFLAQRRGDKWFDSLGQQAEIRGGVERWWKLPEVQQ